MATEFILEILGEFGAGYGEPDNLAVRFLLAAFFWAVLAGTALRQWRREGQPRDAWIAAAALLGLARELWMFVMEYGAKQALLPHAVTHNLYPPLEHLLTQSAYVLTGAAFAHYFGAPRPLLRRYLVGSALLLPAVYMIVQIGWVAFLAGRPEARFGDYPGDLWIHVLMACLLLPVVAWLAVLRHAGRRVPAVLFAGFSLFLLDDLLMVLHLANGGIYPEVFAPLRHNLHIWAIPLFIALYWGELSRRLVEEREKNAAIVGAMGDGVSIHAPDLMVTYQNRAHREMVGDVVGQYCYELYRHRDAVCEDCTVQAAMLDGRVHSAEREYPRSGKVLSVTASPLLDADGKVAAGIEIVRDVTEQRVLEKRSAEAQKLEAVGRLAGGVAHDFNNLLTVILGRTELLLAAGRQGDQDQRDLEEIHRVAERAAALTRQLLAFGRRQPNNPSVLDLSRVLDQTEPILRRLIPENIRLEVVRDTQPHPVLADPSQLEQVVVNLTVNARDAMPGGGTLRIRLGNEEVTEARPGRHGRLGPGQYAVLTVEDSGEGMGKEVLAHLFEPFFTTKEASQGTGLGLATVFGILEQSRGHVEVDSAPHCGSTFRVYLPRTRELGSRSDPRGVLPEEPEAEGTVLVVEDDDCVRELVGGILTDAGYTVLTAARGRDALNQSERHPGTIHLLITDVVMPEMSGLELARELAEHRSDTPVLFMSGYTDDHIAQAGLPPEDLEILAKPFSRQNLLNRVRALIGSRQAA